MPAESTCSNVRQNLANMLDQVVDNQGQDTVIVRRRGARDVALIPASELAGLIEASHVAPCFHHWYAAYSSGEELPFTHAG